MEFIRKPSEMPMQVEERNIPVLTFPRLSQLDMIGHAVTTRLGGVSEGYFRAAVKLHEENAALIEAIERVTK